MHRIIAPLVNFDSEIEDVDFGDGYALQPLGEEERRLIFGTDAIRSNFTWHRLETIHFKLVNGSDSVQPSVAFQLTMLEIIRAMRLSYAGDLGAPLFVHYTPGYSRWVMGGLSPTQRLGTMYRLRAKDVTVVKEMLSALRNGKVRANKRLAIALGRFDDIYGRNRCEEKFLDCFVALESCLTPDSTTEIGYKLAIRSAAILSQTHNPAETRCLIAAGYDVRSRIVHQGLSLQEIFCDKDFKRKLGKLKQTRGLGMSLDCITPMSFTDDLIGSVRSVLRAVIAETTKSLDIDAIDVLVKSLDERIASALSHISP